MGGGGGRVIASRGGAEAMVGGGDVVAGGGGLVVGGGGLVVGGGAAVVGGGIVVAPLCLVVTCPQAVMPAVSAPRASSPAALGTKHRVRIRVFFSPGWVWRVFYADLRATSREGLSLLDQLATIQLDAHQPVPVQPGSSSPALSGTGAGRSR